VWKFNYGGMVNTLLVNLHSLVRFNKHALGQLIIIFNFTLPFLIDLFAFLDLFSDVILNHYLFLFLFLKMSVKVLLVILLELFSVELPCSILLV
jgi:hypothetical protein